MRRRYWNIVVAFITARVCRSPIRTEWGIAGCLPWMCSFRQSFRVSADKTSDYCCFDRKNKTQQQQEKRFLRQHDFPNTCAHQVYIDAELFQCFVRHIFLFFSSTNKKFIEKKRKKKYKAAVQSSSSNFFFPYSRWMRLLYPVTDNKGSIQTSFIVGCVSHSLPYNLHILYYIDCTHLKMLQAGQSSKSSLSLIDVPDIIASHVFCLQSNKSDTCGRRRTHYVCVWVYTVRIYA
jgi:hypothetical protein